MRRGLGRALSGLLALSPTGAFAAVPTATVADPVYEVVVRAERARAPTASATSVGRDRLEATPARTAADALRLIPGLVLLDHGAEGKGPQVFLRGFDAIHGVDFEVTLEGVPLNEWSNVHAQGYLDLAFLIPEVVRRVEVTKGPFTPDQGLFAMAGSARYVLGLGSGERGARVAYTAGSTNRHRALFTWAPEDPAREDLLAVSVLADDGFGDNRSVRRASAMGRVALWEAPDAALRLTVLGSASTFELPGPIRRDRVAAGRVDLLGTEYRSGAGRSRRLLAILDAEAGVEERAFAASAWVGLRDLSLDEDFTGFLLDPERGDARRQTQESLTFGARADVQLGLPGPWSLAAGLGLRGDAFDQREVRVDRAGAPFATRRDLGGLQVAAHGHLGLVLRPVPALRIRLGGRLEGLRVDVRGQDAELPTSPVRVTAAPRASLEWQPAPAVRLFAAYGRGLRPPEARAFTGFEPERVGLSEAEGDGPRFTFADAAEVGARWRLGPRLALAAAGFATFIERESVFDHVSGLNLDLDGTRRLGAELAVTARPVPALTVRAHATGVDAHFRRSGNPVPFAPRFVSGADAQWRAGPLFAGLRALWIAPRPLPFGAKSAHRVALDARLAYRAGRFEAALGLENLLLSPQPEAELHYASDWSRGPPTSQIPALHVVFGPPFNARLTLTAWL